MPPSRRATWLAAIVVFATVSRAIYFLVYRAADPLYGHLLHDAWRYHAWASALARGIPFETGAFYQAPLYPYLVALVYALAGERTAVVYALQMAAGVLTVVVVSRVARRGYGETEGLVAAGLAALYGPFVFYETKLLPVSLAVLIAIVVADRLQVADRAGTPLPFGVAGLSLGLLALLTPGSLLLAPAVALWIAFSRSSPVRARALRVSVFLVGVALPIAPVTLANYRASGDLVPISTNGGITFYQGNNPAARGVYAAPPGFSGSILNQRREERALAEGESGRSLSDAEVSRFWLRRGLSYLAANPGPAVVLVVRKAVLAIGNREQPLEYNPHLDRNPARFLAPLPFCVILALATLALGSGAWHGRAGAPVLLAIGTHAAVLLVFYVSGRYRLPAVPFLLALAGAGAVTLASRPTLRSGALVAVALAASFLYVPVVGSDLAARQTSMGLCDIAGAELTAGRTDEALLTYGRAVETDPTYPFAHLDRAKAARAAGDDAGAEEGILAAIRLAPNLAEAHLDLGVLRYDEGRLDEAAESFSAAYRLDPHDTAAANNLLGTLLRLGENDRAREIGDEMTSRGVPIDTPLLDRLRSLGP